MSEDVVELLQLKQARLAGEMATLFAAYGKAVFSFGVNSVEAEHAKKNLQHNEAGISRVTSALAEIGSVGRVQRS